MDADGRHRSFHAELRIVELRAEILPRCDMGLVFSGLSIPLERTSCPKEMQFIGVQFNLVCITELKPTL